MAASIVLQSLDSLWFFTNVFSSPMTQKQSLADKIEKTPTLTEKSTKPNNPIEEKEAEIPNSPEIPSPDCPKIVNFASKSNSPQPRKFQFEAERFAEGKQSKEIRKQRRRKKDLLDGFDNGEIDYIWTCGSERFGAVKHDDELMRMILPPLNDGMAMKEQIRTWAHAVACSVK